MRLYRVLAGNQRVGYTCGYHWSFLFAYRDAPPESIEINEQCETFRRESGETWHVIERAFTRARLQPSHFIIQVRPNSSRQIAHLVPKLQPRFGRVFRMPNSDILIIASKFQWNASRLNQLRNACGAIAEVKQVQEYDTGN